MKKSKQYLEYLAFKGVQFLITSKSLKTSSDRGSSLGRLLYNFKFKHSVALQNISLAFPNITEAEKISIYQGALENLTRNIGEACYFMKHGFQKQDISYEVIGSEYLQEAKKSKRPIIFFSGHISNWEMLPWIVKEQGLPFAPVFRHPNNPYIDNELSEFREKILGKDIPSFSKSASGARGALKYLLKKNYVGILGDQKTNNGIEAMFFNKKAMTSEAAASLANRSNALIVTGVMSRILRDNQVHYVLTVSPVVETKGKKPKDLTNDLNQTLEEWIKHSPKDWMWIHRRWEKSFYK